MGLFDFKGLIKRFGLHPPSLLVSSGGYFDYENGGVYVEGSITLEEFNGAVVPLSPDDLKFEDAGKYNKQDRKLYCYEDFEVGAKVKHKGDVFTIDQRKDYADFADGLRIYYMVRSDVLGTDKA